MTKDQALHHRTRPSEVSLAEGNKFTGAVFLYMFLALAITTITAVGFGYLLNTLLYESNEGAFVGVLFGAIIAYIPVLIATQISIRRNSKAMVPLYVIYSALMGIMLSTIVVTETFEVVAISFGITCLTFGAMALIAWTSKKDLSMLAVVGSGLLLGLLLMSLFNVILGLILGEFIALTWIISFGIMIAIVLITIFDLNSIKRIAENGGASKNVALMCALNLYVDFIYIFIRIVAVVGRLRSK